MPHHRRRAAAAAAPAPICVGRIASYTGGLVGTASGAALRINNAYATGAVSSQGSGVGGLIGTLNTSGSAVSNVYATGSVSASNTVGGLIGQTAGGTTVTGAYASGFVTANSVKGALIGSLTGTLSNAYWDSYSSGLANVIGTGAGTRTNVASVTSDPSQSAATNYAFSTNYGNVYQNLPGAACLGSATVSGFVMPLGGMRPLLAFELPYANNPGVTSNAGVLTITSAHQLQLIGYDPTTRAGSYILGNNIDLSETARATGSTPRNYSGVWGPLGFTPIGTDGLGNVAYGPSYATLAAIAAGAPNAPRGFNGSFNGGGYTISNLTIARGTVKNVALFGVTQGAISNVIVGGSVTGLNGVGGLVGLLYTGGSVTGASSIATVTGNNLVGGLIGNATDGSTITRSNASGTITGVGDVGGLVGYASGATIGRSFATGTVSGVNYAGGLIGYQYNGATSNSYATGTVTASVSTAGGLIGYLNGGTLLNSYAANRVMSPGIKGGLLGQSAAGASVTSSYWDTTLSGLTTSAGGTGHTTAEMQETVLYPLIYQGWEFTTIWSPPTTGNYPKLR